MNKVRTGTFGHSPGLAIASLSALALLLAMTPDAMAANYKCKGVDGKIEYSDRPCESTKESLNQPRSAAGVVSAPTVAPMVRLEGLFADYEPRLCEREQLATEIDMALRSGELKSPWRVVAPIRVNRLSVNLIVLAYGPLSTMKSIL